MSMHLIAFHKVENPYIENCLRVMGITPEDSFSIPAAASTLIHLSTEELPPAKKAKKGPLASTVRPKACMDNPKRKLTRPSRPPTSKLSRPQVSSPPSVVAPDCTKRDQSCGPCGRKANDTELSSSVLEHVPCSTSAPSRKNPARKAKSMQLRPKMPDYEGSSKREKRKPHTPRESSETSVTIIPDDTEPPADKFTLDKIKNLCITPGPNFCEEELVERFQLLAKAQDSSVTPPAVSAICLRHVRPIQCPGMSYEIEDDDDHHSVQFLEDPVSVGYLQQRMLECDGSIIPLPMDARVVERISKLSLGSQVESLARLCIEMSAYCTPVEIYKHTCRVFWKMDKAFVKAIITGHYPEGWQDVNANAGGDSLPLSTVQYQVRPFYSRIKPSSSADDPSDFMSTSDETDED